VLALVFCNFAGYDERVASSAGVSCGSCLQSFTAFHNKVRDSLTRNALLIEIKQTHIARINLDWDRIPPGDSAHSPKPRIPLKATSTSPVSARYIV
jgi:hypothetical protein